MEVWARKVCFSTAVRSGLFFQIGMRTWAREGLKVEPAKKALISLKILHSEDDHYDNIRPRDFQMQVISSVGGGLVLGHDLREGELHFGEETTVLGSGDHSGSINFKVSNQTFNSPFTLDR